jgi:hypothetical protein
LPWKPNGAGGQTDSPEIPYEKGGEIILRQKMLGQQRAAAII